MADLDEVFDKATLIRRMALAKETYYNLELEPQRALKAAAVTSFAIGFALYRGFWGRLADELRKLAAEEDDESWSDLADTIEDNTPPGLKD